MKQTAIARVVRGVCDAEIDWVMDVASGLEKIKDANGQGCPYDLAIADMQYPLEKDAEIDENAGEVFLQKIQEQQVDLPVIVCSSMRLRIREAYGCVWYHDRNDWEIDLRSLIQKCG